MSFLFGVLLLTILVDAVPFAIPDAVTEAVPPSGTAPSGCLYAWPSTFGIAVINITQSSAAERRNEPTAIVANLVSQIGDGQVQAPTAITIAQVSQIGDGQIQAGMHTVPMNIAPVVTGSRPESMQADTSMTTLSSKPTRLPCSDSTNNPFPTVAPAASSTSSSSLDASPTPPPLPTPHINTSISSSSPPPDDSQMSPTFVSCHTPTTLTLHLLDGILTDARGRTGYIASNFQFQFDSPPQSGALFTAGWSVCADGVLALGGQRTFWQCLSGDFYNLYDRYWARQCSEVVIRRVEFVDCP